MHNEGARGLGQTTGDPTAITHLLGRQVFLLMTEGL
jgi:hypothetical protein